MRDPAGSCRPLSNCGSATTAGAMEKQRNRKFFERRVPTLDQSLLLLPPRLALVHEQPLINP